jgi:hypothetical protein
MQPLSAPELLAVWEENWRQSSLRQGLALLAAAHPEESFETLAQMPMGRYNAALLTLHAWHFGPALTAVTDCPGCGELVEVTLDAPGLCAQAAELAPAWLEIAYAERALRFRLPSPADLAAAGEAATIEAARQILAQRCVEGAAPPAALLPEIAAAMERADPLAVVELGGACPHCGHGWSAFLDVAAFVWREVQNWAQRTLQEIHLLARAYGWGERDILALSPSRRQAYLQMIMG